LGIYPYYENSYCSFFVSFFSLLSSCKYCKSQQVDGGPCSYNKVFYPAKVIEILKLDSNIFEILMTINTPNTNGNDTISYANAYGSYMDSTEIDTLKVKIGTFFKYKIMDIETGSCSPHLEQLVMEKFEK
jgi:hypothetical protein